MDIKIDRAKSEQTTLFDTRDLIGRLSTGRAILFTGAGFSTSTKNFNEEEPLRAKDLAKEICRLGQFDEDEDLRFATDYYIDNCDKICGKTDLVSLLKKQYTLKEVSEIHETICSVNWRRFYTTNYDKSIEIAAAKTGKIIECIDASSPVKSYYKRENLCVHLNGSIDSLTEETIENSFKLSTSSYISADSFVNSDWNYYFRRDLERSSAIVFVGYSMYDIEVQKILYENRSMKEKTYFIMNEGINDKTKFLLSKFGSIIPIGVDGFANLIRQNESIVFGNSYSDNLQSLAKYEISQEKSEIRDFDIERMIMYGDIENKLIDDAVTTIKQSRPYLIIREHLSLAVQFIENNQNVIFYGDMGNGKSMLLRELQSHLSMSSIESYYMADCDGDYISDIDLIAKSGRRAIIHIDGYERYLDVITHFCNSVPTNINIIAAARTSEHERCRQQLKSIDFNYNEICLDMLSNNEVSIIVDIMDNLGAWGDDAGLSYLSKISKIEREHCSQISLTLLSFFNSPQIKDRISLILSNLMGNSQIKDTIFAIAFIQVLDRSCNFSLIAEVAGNDMIYKSELQQNESFKNLFKVQELMIKQKSSLFCQSIIKNHFSSTYVIKQLQKIAKIFDSYDNKDYERGIIFKSTLRFSFVEQIISDDNKKGNLQRHYEELKTSVVWLKNDPHFWLQFGMAYIMFQDYPKAQKYIDQAYSIARSKRQYYTNSIDAQQARLFILCAIQHSNAASIYEFFSKAHSLLSNLENNAYKFRQVLNYRDFYDSCFSKLSSGNKVSFQRACQAMTKTIESAVSDGEVTLSSQSSVQKARTNLEYILESMNRHPA